MNRIVETNAITRSKVKFKRRKRTCLMCGRTFNSQGPYNRRCPRCNYLLDHAREGTYYEPTTYRVEHRQFSDFSDTI